jgi:YVTN family beta-propeller protein
VISPDGSTLYVSLNGDGELAKLDLASGTVTARIATGDAPRSIAISDDGTALYVVDYNSNLVSKVRTSDMVELAELKNRENPIGIT